MSASSERARQIDAFTEACRNRAIDLYETLRAMVESYHGRSTVDWVDALTEAQTLLAEIQKESGA